MFDKGLGRSVLELGTGWEGNAFKCPYISVYNKTYKNVFSVRLLENIKKSYTYYYRKLHLSNERKYNF